MRLTRRIGKGKALPCGTGYVDKKLRISNFGLWNSLREQPSDQDNSRLKGAEHDSMEQ